VIVCSTADIHCLPGCTAIRRFNDCAISTYCPDFAIIQKNTPRSSFMFAF
jgi:hypothetical protein